MAKFSKTFQSLYERKEYARWDVVHETMERFLHFGEFRFYEGGAVSCINPGVRDPDLRLQNQGVVGSAFKLLAGTTPLTPQGECKPMAWFTRIDNPVVVVDEEHNRIVNAEAVWGTKPNGYLHWDSVDAPPVGARPIVMSKPRPKYAKELLERLRDRYEVAKVTSKLLGREHNGWRYKMPEFADEAKLLAPWDEKTEYRVGLLALGAWEELVKQIARERVEFPYLLIRGE